MTSMVQLIWIASLTASTSPSIESLRDTWKPKSVISANTVYKVDNGLDFCK